MPPEDLIKLTEALAKSEFEIIYLENISPYFKHYKYKIKIINKPKKLGSSDVHK